MRFPPEVLERLSQVADLRVLVGAELRHHTRFRLGGPCWFLADAETSPAYQSAYKLLSDSKISWTSIGRGTNLVVNDAGYHGAILRYSAAQKTVSHTIISVDAGAELNDLVDFANAQALAGMESMAGIPGWVGGAIYGNAGAYGQSIHQTLESVEFFDGEQVREWTNEECGFRYRHSSFKEHKELQILSAKFRFEPGDQQLLQEKSKNIRAARDAKFPPSMACAGSIFKNFLWKDLPEKARLAVPPNKIIEGKVPAGWFLEQVGARGLEAGGIRVADYHANLIYNTGAGTTADLLSLIGTLKNRVTHSFDLPLEEEVQYLGFA